MPQYFGKLPTTNQPWTGISAVDGFRQDGRNIIVECDASIIAIA